jgi:hypothetical protein
MAGRTSALIVTLGLLAAAPAAQSPRLDAGAVFRVFLKTGEALPSYGESAIVGDRVVFALLMGVEDTQPALQLMSLPAARVDLDRTGNYARALRAAHYAATRGEVDYAAMTQEVQRTLAEVTSVTDPGKRLELAESARQRLLSWSAGTYGYRAAEIRQLAGLFDEVIATLRAATGQRQFALDLHAWPEPPSEPLLPLPDANESVRLAIAASRAADSADDKLAVLRAASEVVKTDPAAADLRAAVASEIDLETRAAAAYTALAADIRARASAARLRGDVAGLTAVIDALRSRDQALGGRRPEVTSALFEELDRALASVRAYRAALDHYTMVRSSLLAYERTVRPVMSGFDGLVPVFNAVRDSRFTAYERLVGASARLAGFTDALLRSIRRRIWPTSMRRS